MTDTTRPANPAPPGLNVEALARTARVVTHPAIQARTLGSFNSVDHGIWYQDLVPGQRGQAVQFHIAPGVSALLAWFYLLDTPTIAAERFSGGSVHVYMQGTLDGDPVVAWSGLSARVRDALDVVWGDNGKARLSVHQLRNAQVGHRLAAVAS